MSKTAAIRSQARRAALAKAAEAQFTPEEQAFAAGFCKAAEVAGVDPAALYKAAAAAGPKAPSKPAAKSPSSDVVHGIGNSRLERMGTVTAPAVTALLGSLLGGRGAARRLAGGVAGLGTGLLGNLGGSGLAYVTPTRSGEAQLKHDSVLHVLKNLLLPGVGSYNKAKRLEREQVHKWYN